jgi:methionyl-tRNA formyltransferase
VIIAYGQIVPARLIEIPRLGWINVHASLLPKYRGAAPIQWALIGGETRTGVTTMQIDAGLDTGPTLETAEIEIGADETAPELSKRLAELGAPLIVSTLRKLERGEIAPHPQDASQATLARPLKKEDGRIDWSQRATEIYNRIRGLEPWPGAFSTFRGQTAQIWGRPAERDADVAASAIAPGSIELRGAELFTACGEHTSLRIERVRLEGRKAVSARDFANGARLTPGEEFGA